MNQLLTEKKYVDLMGLKALIDKIGALRAEYIGKFDERDVAYNDLLDRVDAIISVSADDPAANVSLAVEGGYQYTEAASVLECMAKYLNGLRAELGASEDKTLSERVAQLEEEVQTATTGLLDRTTKLETESFAKVEINTKEEISATNNIHIDFKNAADEVKGSVDIDTSDFVIDGLLGDVHLVSIVDNGNIVFDHNGSGEHSSATETDNFWKKVITESAGKTNGERFFVFSFKTTETGTATDSFTGEATGLQNIWVPVKDLHDSFKFKAVSEDGYVALTTEAVHDNTGSTVVTYTSTLTEKSIKGIDLANGEYTKPDGSAVRGVEALDADLATAEDNVEDLQNKVENGWVEKVDNGDGTFTDVTREGLLKRTLDIEKHLDTEVDPAIESLESWTQSSIVSVDDINAYFDYVVYAGDTAAANARAAAKANTDAKFAAGDTADYRTYTAEPPVLAGPAGELPV